LDPLGTKQKIKNKKIKEQGDGEGSGKRPSSRARGPQARITTPVSIIWTA
jgi:hypothetical protein